MDGEGEAVSATARFLAIRPEIVKVPGADVAVRRLGDGPDVVFVHGWPLWGFTFREVVDRLADRFRCWVVDAPGGGDTAWTESTDFTWPGQAATVKAVVDGLGLGEYGLVGQDSGAMIARQLALVDPRVRRLAMTNTEIPGHRPPWIPLFRALMFVPGTNLSMRALLRSRAFLRAPLGFGGAFADLDRIDGDFTEHVVGPLVRDPRRMEGHNRFLRGWSWELLDAMPAEHAKIRVPVRLIWGADDPTFPLDRAVEMAKQFPDAQVDVVQGAKLFVQEERPDEVARSLTAFLG